MERSFKERLDPALLAFGVLKRLGCGSVKTFNQRLRSQKTQYFAQLFGVSPSYEFNLYLRGPYSPQLAHDLYQISQEGLMANRSEFVPEELEIMFGKLADFISEKTNRQLELVATLHWLLKVAGLEREKAIEKFKELKNPNSAEIKESFDFLKELLREQ